MFEQVLECMKGLVAVTADMASELRVIRRALTSPGPGGPPDEGLGEGAETTKLPPVIPLDFEAYVK
jgi:hypothetical protein